MSDWILTIAAFALLLSPKQLPRTSRTVGYVVGRSAGFVSRTKALFDNMAKQSNLSDLNNELRQQIKEIDSISAEIRNEIRTSITGIDNVKSYQRNTQDRVTFKVRPAVELKDSSLTSYNSDAPLRSRTHVNSASIPEAKEKLLNAGQAQATIVKTEMMEKELQKEATGQHSRFGAVPLAAIGKVGKTKIHTEKKSRGGSNILLEVIEEEIMMQKAEEMILKEEIEDESMMNSSHQKK